MKTKRLLGFCRDLKVAFLKCKQDGAQADYIGIDTRGADFCLPVQNGAFSGNPR